MVAAVEPGAKGANGFSDWTGRRAPRSVDGRNREKPLTERAPLEVPLTPPARSLPWEHCRRGPRTTARTPPPPRGRTVTLRELLRDRYAPVRGLSDRSVVIYSHTLDRFRDFLGREPAVADLEEETIGAFLTWRGRTIHSPRRGRPSPATVRKDQNQLVSLARYAFHKRILETFPIVKPIRVPQPLPRGFTADDVSALIREARKRTRAVAGLPSAWWWSTLIHAAWQTGCRIGELRALRWGCVDPDRRELVFLAATRKGSTRDIARRITPELAAEMEQHRQPPAALVWPWIGHPTALYKSMEILCRKAGTPQKRFHALRRASASYVAAGGGDPVTHLDHASPVTTSRHYIDDRILIRPDGLSFLPPLDLTDPAA